MKKRRNSQVQWGQKRINVIGKHSSFSEERMLDAVAELEYSQIKLLSEI